MRERLADAGLEIPEREQQTSEALGTLHQAEIAKWRPIIRANGIKVKTLCTEGVCGTCRVRLLGGKADHRDEVLTDAQREREIQVCVSRAMPGETLILDL